MLTCEELNIGSINFDANVVCASVTLPPVRRASPEDALRLSSRSRMPQLALLKYCDNGEESNTIKAHANI